MSTFSSTPIYVDHQPRQICNACGKKSHSPECPEKAREQRARHYLNPYRYNMNAPKERRKADKAVQTKRRREAEKVLHLWK